MIETEKRSECWFSSTQKWHKTIPFLLLLLFFSFFILFDVLFGVMALSLSLHLHRTHTHSCIPCHFLSSFVSFIIYTCLLHSLMHISRGQFHSEEIVLWVCVCAFFIFFGFLLTLKLHSFLLLAHFTLTYNFHFDVPLFITQGKFETNKSHRNVYGDKWSDHSKGVMANVNFIWIV